MWNFFRLVGLCKLTRLAQQVPDVFKQYIIILSYMVYKPGYQSHRFVKFGSILSQTGSLRAQLPPGTTAGIAAGHVALGLPISSSSHHSMKAI